MKESKSPTLSCTLCDSDIPADEDTKPGDTVYCSYCKIGLKVIKRKNGQLSVEFDEDDAG